MKLWKVVVNGIGWNSPETFYFDDKCHAEIFECWIRNEGKATDGVEWAGVFTSEHGKDLVVRTIKLLGGMLV